MKRDSMGLGSDVLTLYCDAGHGRLDLAFVDVSGAPGTWQGWVHKAAVEGGGEHVGTFSAQSGRDFVRWVGERTTGKDASSMVRRETPLRLSCPRCRRGRLPSGRTVRVRGGVLHEIVTKHGLADVSMRFVDEYMRRALN